jgi:hypothetical protein
MRKALCVLSVLAIVAIASAEVDVRIWVTTQDPTLTGLAFMPGYGPFTPFAVESNGNGSFDAHRTGFTTPPPQTGSLDGDTSAIDVTKLNVEEPMGLPLGTPVYLWAGFANPTAGFPNLLGAVPAGTKIQGMHLELITTGAVTLDPHWYQIHDIGGTTRWETTSDMSGNTVTMVGINSPAWQNSAVATDLMQATLTISRQTGGAILLGAIKPTGAGELKIGLGFNGIASNVAGTTVTYFPGTETAGIAAGVVAETEPPRVGATVQASWIPEPASALLIALGALVLRRR